MKFLREAGACRADARAEGNMNEEEQQELQEPSTTGGKPRRRRRSRYFGYACARSFELRNRLLQGKLSVDDMLDVVWSEAVACPRHHDEPCKCQRLDHYWVSDDHGRLALKLFLKHLEGDAMHAFKQLVIDNFDRVTELRELAKEHPKLLDKIRLLLIFS